MMIKLLFPLSHAFRIFINTLIYKFIKALSLLLYDIKVRIELVFCDLFPETTRNINLWYDQFGILDNDVNIGLSKYLLLKSLWMGITGGQSTYYLKKILDNIDKKIKIVENTPLKNPRDSNSVVQAVCNHRIMVCGNRKAVCSYRIGDMEFIPMVIINDGETLYDIPNDPAFWSTCVYICGTVIRSSSGKILYLEKIEIDKKWKSFINYIVLKIKPVQLKMVLYIKYI
jgi:hypothetical protein